ncbi:hypothetical protein EBA31_09170 [Serratia sp. P2ACOL2]|nr:hypothetical protein EBA31_09170 [Serratia sp. P2ACOL2]
MRLSIEYGSSKFTNMKEAFRLIAAGFLLLLGRKIVIHQEINSQQIIDALRDGCEKARQSGTLQRTQAGENLTNDQ